MSLADDRKTNFYDEILGDGHPQVEVVTFGDGSTTWTATVKVTTDEAPDTRGPVAEVEPETDRFLIRVGKDESHAKSGVAVPVVGLRVFRAGESVPYAFTGRILAATAHSHTLEFTRDPSLIYGKSR